VGLGSRKKRVGGGDRFTVGRGAGWLTAEERSVSKSLIQFLGAAGGDAGRASLGGI
jgi:hypothetical protein